MSKILIRVFIVILIFKTFNINSLSAQYRDDYVNSSAKNYNYTYRDFIKSVRFFPSDAETAYPIVELNSPINLLLEFDDIEADNKNYFYKIIHCNFEWQPSKDIAPMDYIDGFQENRFYESSSSFNTYQEYTHYQLKLPNSDIKWTKSGNYLLKVYLNDDENDLVITRRFVVTETKMKVVPQVRRSATPPYAQSHQELSFRIEHAGVYIGHPSKDIKVAVLQNGRWDNAVTKLEPTFVKNEQIVYDLQGQLMFPGMKEFRPLDIRSCRHRGPQVERIEQNNFGFKLHLFPMNSRNGVPYLFTNDLNGKFIISSHDNNNARERGEYALVYFNLQSPKLSNKEVYVLGEFSDFQPYARNKMTYNEDKSMYEAQILLKNGFYDFEYVAVDKSSGKVEEQYFEGSTFETENDYLFLVYYRPFGGRYDQAVAVQKVSSTMR